MSASPWKKIASAKSFLEVREGRYKTAYRVRFRQGGVKLEKNLEGDFRNWREAEREAERLIYEARYGKKPRDPKGIRTDMLCDEIVALKKPKADATYQQTRLFFEKHIKPFLLGQCAYFEEDKLLSCPHSTYLSQGTCIFAAHLTPSVWLTYKAHLRLHRPTVSLFNHWKFFTMLFKFAFERGLLERPAKLAFDEEKEDFRERGQVIPDEAFRKFLGAANPTWHDRAILQRLTGQRPGVIRRLRKDQVNLDTGVVSVEKADSKNRRAYSFILPSPAMEILRARLARKYVQDSPFFFPMETDHSRPMDKHLGGWNAAWARSGVASGYTPHDLRHTFLTHRFKNSSNPALVCFQCDLSLEEAMQTYIHFTAEDTRVLAEQATTEAGSAELLSPIKPAEVKA